MIPTNCLKETSKLSHKRNTAVSRIQKWFDVNLYTLLILQKVDYEVEASIQIYGASEYSSYPTRQVSF